MNTIKKIIQFVKSAGCNDRIIFFTELIFRRKKAAERYKRKPLQTHKFLKTIYLLVWISIIGFYIIMFCKKGMMPQNAIGIYHLILFIISMVLNCFSYFICCAYVYFLRALSNLGESLNKWRRNKYIPSLSKGYQVLMSSVKQSSFIFIVIALLYAITYILILLSLPDAFRNKHMLALSALSIVTFLYSMGASIILMIAPVFFLQRILNKWKIGAMRTLENDLDEFTKQRKMVEVDIVLNRMERLDKDRVKYDLSALITVTMAATTIVLNVLTIVKQLS